MANTAPACGQCRHCRERGEAGQLHGIRSALILTGGLRALLPKKLLSEAPQGTISWLESYTVTADTYLPYPFPLFSLSPPVHSHILRAFELTSLQVCSLQLFSKLPDSTA